MEQKLYIRIIHAGKDLRISLNRLLARSRVDTEFRPGSSRLYSLRSGIL